MSVLSLQPLHVSNMDTNELQETKAAVRTQERRVDWLGEENGQKEREGCCVPLSLWEGGRGQRSAELPGPCLQQG